MVMMELQTNIFLFPLGKAISEDDFQAYSKSPTELNNEEYSKNISIIHVLFLPL